MSARPAPIRYRRLRPPQEDGAILVDPPWDGIEALVAENAARRSDYHDTDLCGRSLGELARLAREDLLCQAHRWTETYRDVDTVSQDLGGRIFLAGHQPQVFHPGVWLKNFALGTLARQHGAVGVNLLIDGDTCKSTTLPVPGGSARSPVTAEIPFDQPADPIPYEQRQILDPERFADFGSRVIEQLAPLVSDPLIGQYWPLVLDRARFTNNLGTCLAQARHKLEGSWGLTTLEVPQSRVCESEAFRWFTAYVLARIEEFRSIYNGVLGEYRRAHRLRSPAQPVPDLTYHGPWQETPFWVYTAESPRRRPLLVRPRSGRLSISDGQGLDVELPLGPGKDLSEAVAVLAELADRGVKIRSRALVTTLYARLMLADLFVHGIGGAKYDAVTDALIERFFGLHPPGFLTVSATLLLPIDRPTVCLEQQREIRHRLRRLTYHPERFVSVEAGNRVGESNGPAELMAEKQRWIETPQTPENARIRCHAIRRINRELQPWVQTQRGQGEAKLLETAQALHAQQILASREWGFCLYPEKTFRTFLAALLPKLA